MDSMSNETDKLKIAIDNNFRVINDLLCERKTAVERNDYHPKATPAHPRWHDTALISHLEATQNIFKIIIDRLDKLERKNQ